MFKQVLQDREFDVKSKIFEGVVDWLKNFPSDLPDIEKEKLRGMICKSFRLTEEELANHVIGNGHKSFVEIDDVKAEKKLVDLLPRSGIIQRYIGYTSHSEAPLAYHLFSILCGIGCILNRRVYMDMGYYKLYSTLGIIILGPSGIKKTSAANILVDILQQLALVKIYSEKLTPEALIEAMKGDSTGLIYAPEMTVFLSRQKYMEGMVQLITRFMDCPDLWESGTISRSKSVLKNVAISSLMCSTLDWFIKSTPEDSFGGGFIARNLLIIQNSSSRCEPVPRPGDPDDRGRLVTELAYLHQLEGEVKFDERSFKIYDQWYRTAHKTESENPEHEMLSTYYQRKPDHIKRVAILLHMAEHPDLLLCADCFLRALSLLDWIEQFLPSMLQQMFRSQAGAEAEQVLRVIRAHGRIQHSILIRRLGYLMNAKRVRELIGSLKEGGQVQEINQGSLGHWYAVTND